MEKEKLFSKTIVVWLTAALCCFLWGSAFPAIKAGYGLLGIASGETASIILFAGIRFFLAGILTLLIFSLVYRKALLPRREALPKITVLSLFQTILQYVFFYLGLAFTSGERASVINGTSVFIALLLSALLFRYETLSARKIIGCLLGFFGVVLVSLDVFSQNGSSFLGEGLILLSSTAYAFSTVLMKKYAAGDNPALLSGWQFLLGGAVMIVCGLAGGGSIGNVSGKAVLLLLYLALVSAVAYSLWSVLLKYNPVSRVAVCGFMTPVFGFFLSMLFGGGDSTPGIYGVLALLLVVCGMLLVNGKLVRQRKE